MDKIYIDFIEKDTHKKDPKIVMVSDKKLFKMIDERKEISTIIEAAGLDSSSYELNGLVVGTEGFNIADTIFTKDIKREAEELIELSNYEPWREICEWKEINYIKGGAIIYGYNINDNIRRNKLIVDIS